GTPSLTEMVIRYIKHLVQITTTLSSFYVNVGLNRILYSCSTSEAQMVYEMLAAPFLGSDEYRRAKSVLMVKIAARFGHLLRIAKIDHGEHRFEVSDNQSQWLNLAIKCLTAFTPWSSLANCAQFAADTRSRQALTRLVTDRSDDRNESELKYC